MTGMAMSDATWIGNVDWSISSAHRVELGAVGMD